MFKRYLVYVLLMCAVLDLAISHPALGLYSEDNQNEETINYLPGQFIIKFKEESGQILDSHLSPPGYQLFSSGTGLSSIDALNSQYGVIQMDPIFTALKQKQLNSGKTYLQLFQEIKDKYPVRSARAPNDTIVPNLTNIYLVTLNDLNVFVPSICAEYQNDPNVEYAQPNYKRELQSLSNDTYVDPDQDDIWSIGNLSPDFSDMWGLERIGMGQAWNIIPSNTDIIVAVSDTGVDYTHPDIVDNIWQNVGDHGLTRWGEDADHDGHTLEWNGSAWVLDPGDLNGIDDDGNGYVDDLIGYDFGNQIFDPDPMDDVAIWGGHGTHVAGIIAASTNNNLGIASVSPHCRIMVVKGYDTPTGQSTYLDKTIYYATDNGADVINMSWGAYGWAPYDQGAISYAVAAGVVCVAAAGNNNRNMVNFSPAQLPHVISVAAWSYNDTKASFSNWGDLIDVAAPGVDILSLKSKFYNINGGITVGDKYVVNSGTSMATPHVAGLAALILSVNNLLKIDEVAEIIHGSSTDVLASGKDPYSGYGLINARDAVTKAQDSLITPLSELTATDNPASATIQPNDSSIKVTAEIINNSNLLSGSSVYQFFAGSPQAGGTLIFQDTLGPLNPGQIINIEKIFSSSEVPSNTTLITLRLDANNNVTEYNEKNDIAIPVTLSYLTGWPPTMDHAAIRSSPAIADINNDGKLEIVIGTYGSRVYVLNADGSFFPGWPQRTNTSIKSSPTTADLDQQYPGLEVIVGGYKLLYAWHSDGTPVSGWPVTTGHYTSVSSPVVADIDNDGFLEVIVGCSDNYLYCFKSNGQLFWKCPTGNFIFSSPTIADIDPYNRGLEIVFGSLDGYLYCLKNNGDLLWRYNTNNWVESSPAIADLDSNNPGLEVVVGSDGGEIYCLTRDGDTQNGKVVWSYDTNIAIISSSPAIADINGDGKLEVIVGGSDGNIYCLTNEGALLWAYQTGYRIESSPAIADIDPNYPGLEIVVGCDDTKLYALHADGTPVWGWPQITKDIVYSSPAIADLNGNGKLEVVAGSLDGNLYAWVLPWGVSGGPLPWPKFHYDLRNTGYYQQDCLIKNSSFEIDSGIDFYPDTGLDDAIANNNLADGWSTGYAVIDSNMAYASSKSLKITVNNGRGCSIQDIPVEQNKSYEVSGYVKTDAVDNNCYGTILTEAMDANHNNIWGYNNCQLNINPDDIQRLFGDNPWTKIKFNVTANNPNAKFLRVICYNTPGSYPVGTGTVWFDAINVKEITNSAPVIDPPIGSKTVAEGQNLQFTVSASDINHDHLIYQSDDSLPEGAVLNPDTGAFTWTPGYADAGVYYVNFQVSDSQLTDSEEVEINVSNTNRVPVLLPIGNKTVNEGGFLTFTFGATDPDTEGTGKDPLGGNAICDSLAFRATGLPANAQLINNIGNTATFTFQPDYFQAGTYPVHFEVTDGYAVDSEDIAITVNPVLNYDIPPRVNPIGDKEVNLGLTSILSFQVTGVDANGLPLTFLAEPLQAGMTFSPNGYFSWNPGTYHIRTGQYTVSFTATSSHNIPSTPQTVNIVVFNGKNDEKQINQK